MSSRAYLKRAHATLKAVRVLCEEACYHEAVSRAYYAMFYAAEAILLHEGHHSKSHRGVHILFDQHLVKTGRVSVEIGSSLRRAYENRQLADYAPDIEVSEETALQASRAASDFVETIASMLNR